MIRSYQSSAIDCAKEFGGLDRLATLAGRVPARPRFNVCSRSFPMRSSRPAPARFFTALFSLICAVLCLAQPTAAHAQNGTISGTVSGYVGSSPAQVSAQPVGGAAIYSANATPNYTITVPPGLYTVAVTNPSSGWYINPTNYQVTVEAGTNNGGKNFTLSPIGSNYVVSGHVYINAVTCPEAATAMYINVTISGNNGFSSTQNVIVQTQSGQGQFQFLNLPYYGNYTISVAPTSAVYGDTLSVISSTSLNYESDLYVTRKTYNLCGRVMQTNGQPGSGIVYINRSQQLNNVLSATVQSDGTYTFENLPQDYYGIWMVNSSSWSYSPAAPAYQNANIATSDASGINFTATPLVANVTGNFVGLPNGTFGSVYLYKLVGNVWSTQPIASTSTQGTIPWVIRNVSPGTYYVAPGPPSAQGTITPLFLGAFTVPPGAASVNAGTFTYNVTGSGTLQASAYTVPQMTWIQTLNTSPVLTVTGQYYNDVNYYYFISGMMYLYPQGRPMNISMTLHPGSYTWKLTGQGPLRVSQTSGAFTIQPRQTTNIGSFIFTLPGAIVRFDANSCNSAVCSSGAPDVAKINSIKLPNNHALSATIAKPQDTTVTCVTNPTADLASKAAIFSAVPHTSTPLATIGGNAAVTTPAPTCTPTVDFTTVPTIDVNGGFGPPDPNNPGYNQQDSTVPASNTTVQFSGVIYAAVDGTYQFQTNTNGPIALTVNNTSVINSWTDVQQTQTGSLLLTGGHQYPFTMSYAYDTVTSAQVNLSWQQPTDSAINTLDSSFYDQASTLVPLNDLTLQQFGQIVDNYTTGDSNDQQNALAAGYTIARTEGCVYSDQQSGTIPLYVYTNETDNFSTATPAGQSTASAGNYVNNGLAGYIFPTPLTDGSSIPLQNWFGNNDYYAAASSAGISAAQQAGYVFVETEGYILPATNCQ